QTYWRRPTANLFPYTTLFRSDRGGGHAEGETHRGGASGAEEPDAELGAGPRRRGGGQRGAGRDRELLQLGYHLACEQAHVPLRLGVVHAGVAEDADERVVADATPDVEDLLVALLGRAPDLE